jgi:hypothetical protein
MPVQRVAVAGNKHGKGVLVSGKNAVNYCLIRVYRTFLRW